MTARSPLDRRQPIQLPRAERGERDEPDRDGGGAPGQEAARKGEEDGTENEPEREQPEAKRGVSTLGQLAERNDRHDVVRGDGGDEAAGGQRDERDERGDDDQRRDQPWAWAAARDPDAEPEEERGQRGDEIAAAHVIEMSRGERRDLEDEKNDVRGGDREERAHGRFGLSLPSRLHRQGRRREQRKPEHHQVERSRVPDDLSERAGRGRSPVRDRSVGAEEIVLAGRVRAPPRRPPRGRRARAGERAGGGSRASARTMRTTRWRRAAPEAGASACSRTAAAKLRISKNVPWRTSVGSSSIRASARSAATTSG